MGGVEGLELREQGGVGEGEGTKVQGEASKLTRGWRRKVGRWLGPFGGDLDPSTGWMAGKGRGRKWGVYQRWPKTLTNPSNPNPSCANS